MGEREYEYALPSPISKKKVAGKRRAYLRGFPRFADSESAKKSSLLISRVY